jgi:hypothetical protein
MRRILFFLLTACVAAHGDTIINGNRAILGTWDASGAARVKPFRAGTSLPATCQSGEAFFKTNADAGKNLYLCNPADTWTQASGVGGSGQISTFGVSLDGGGSPVSAGQKGYVTIPYACTITGWSLQADQPGNLAVEIDRKNAAIPAVTADSIVQTSPPALSGAQLRIGRCESGDCAGWSVKITANDVIGFSENAAESVTRATLVVNCQR